MVRLKRARVSDRPEATESALRPLPRSAVAWASFGIVPWLFAALLTTEAAKEAGGAQISALGVAIFEVTAVVLLALVVERRIPVRRPGVLMVAARVTCAVTGIRFGVLPFVASPADAELHRFFLWVSVMGGVFLAACGVLLIGSASALYAEARGAR